MGASILNNSNTVIKYQTSTTKTDSNSITQINIKKLTEAKARIAEPPTKTQRRHSVIVSSTNKLSLPFHLSQPAQSEIKEEEEENADDDNQTKTSTQTSASNANDKATTTNTQDNHNTQQQFPQKFMRKGNRSISLIQKNKLGSNIFKEELKLKVTVNTVVEENKGLPTMKYKILSRLGDGSYGTVYLAMNIITKAKVAMKKIKKVKENEVDDLEIKNEIDILKKLDHPSVVKILEFYTTDDAYYIVTDYCQYGELYNQIKYKYNETQLAVLFYQVFSGLCYLHQFNIVHRDLKLENILISEIELDEQTQKKYFWIKIIDFGTAKIFEKNKSEKAVVGSSYYIAPEVLKKAYNEKCDTWSAGVLLYMILVGRAPFDGEDDEEIIEKIKKGEFNRNHRKLLSASPEIQDLVNKLLEIDPSVRLSAAEALMHPWFKKFNGKSLYMNIDEKKIMKYLQRLMNYEINTKFEQMVHAFIVHNIPPSKESKDILKIFRVFNTNDDCKLSKRELEEGLLKYFAKEEVHEKINDIFLLLDGANHGYIEYEEFLRACLDKAKVLCKENLVYAFNFFDKDNSGKITVDKVKVAFSESNVSEEVFQNIFSEICLNEDGELDFNEFQDVMFGSSSQQK